MLDRRHRRLRLPFVLLLCAALCSAAVEEPVAGPSHPSCDPECSKYGTCGEGGCRCPFGRLGAACEIDFLAPCKPAPGGIPNCGVQITKSCECMRRCEQYLCRQDSAGQRVCEGMGSLVFFNATHISMGRGCYEREGVPPDEQYSRIPEPEETNVTCYAGHAEGAQPLNCSDALRQGDGTNAPMSLCPNACNNRGYCVKEGDAPPKCRCHRGSSGAECEVEENVCFRRCSGRGTCVDQFCHCQPPYFSIGCTRSKVYPANHSLRNPANFKIYMYELPTQLAYDRSLFYGFKHHDFIYTAETEFLEQFLGSPVRTEDPSEAHLFFIPSYTFSHAGALDSGQEHVHLLLDHIKHAHPWWNRTGGRDHFFWTTTDLGACGLSGLADSPIRVVHFGHHTNPGNHGPRGHVGNPEYGCFHPLRDVVALPFWGVDGGPLDTTGEMTVGDLVQYKSRLLFFAGDVRPDEKGYSGRTRQELAKLVEEWKDPDIEFMHGGVGNGPEYEMYLRSSRFCLAPSGHGWGNRLQQAMVCGCVPVIIQEHVFQPYEELLPYEDFSIRLNNADLPRLREILRGVSDQQYRSLLTNLKRHVLAFSWNADKGGQAFEFLIASLRRRYLNLKALYF